MSSFDFSDIEQVNRIELQPNELVVFRTPEHITEEQGEELGTHFKGTPLEGRVVFLTSAQWDVLTIDAGDVT